MNKFASWDDVLAHVASGKVVYYQAPMNWRPVYVVSARVKGKKIRIGAQGDSDAFTADDGHLDRFRYQ
jgi:hypothetical protein